MAKHKNSAEAGRDRPRRKDYSRTYQTIADIWRVLAEHAGSENPLSVAEICRYLDEDAGSPSTVRRVMEEGTAAIDAIAPQSILRATEKRSSHSTVSRLLKKAEEAEVEMTPRLKCVRKIANGFEPYELRTDREDFDETANNQPRYYYLEHILTQPQYRLLTDVVRFYPFLSRADSEALLNGLAETFPGYGREPLSLYGYKRGNPGLFEVLRTLDKAVRSHRPVGLRYQVWRLIKARDGSWQPVLEERSGGPLGRVEPYALLWANGYYYLVAKNGDGKVVNLRVDRILSAAVIRAEAPFSVPPDFDPAEWRDMSPAMQVGKPHFIRMNCQLSMVGAVLDFFGSQARFSRPNGHRVEFVVRASRQGALLFAMEYAGRVEVLDPPELREAVRKGLETALKRYQKAAGAASEK